jgi:hypothetical protein
VERSETKKSLSGDIIAINTGSGIKLEAIPPVAFAPYGMKKALLVGKASFNQ